jgi:hypothetical protein
VKGREREKAGRISVGGAGCGHGSEDVGTDLQGKNSGKGDCT